MTPWLFTSEWGALYLVVLALLMTPCLFFRNRRYLALAMFLLFACDRLAVNVLPQELALGFLAFAYMLVTIAIVVTHSGRTAAIAGIALLITSLIFVAGSLGVADWDTAGTIQEICGLIAMLSIIFRRHDGGSHAVLGFGLARSRGPAAHPGFASQRRERD